MFAVAILPIGDWLMIPLESRFPLMRSFPARVDGIVVLGGIVDQYTTKATGQLSLGDGVERLTEFSALAKRYPNARLVFTGGSASLTDQDVKEADMLAPFLSDLGLDPKRVIFENRARNTFENVSLSKALVNPAKGESWILITSARHMPRSVGVFRKAGFLI